MSKRVYSIINQELGKCPRCGQPYGYLVDAETNEPVNEFSYCVCEEEGLNVPADNKDEQHIA